LKPEGLMLSEDHINRTIGKKKKEENIDSSTYNIDNIQFLDYLLKIMRYELNIDYHKIKISYELIDVVNFTRSILRDLKPRDTIIDNTKLYKFLYIQFAIFYICTHCYYYNCKIDIRLSAQSLYKRYKEINIYLYLHKECNERNIEGEMIRNTLNNMKINLSQLVSLTINKIEYCNNTNIDNYINNNDKEKYDITNNIIKDITEICNNKDGKLFFFIINIINITDSIIYNNPSLIPYIDLYELNNLLIKYEELKKYPVLNNIKLDIIQKIKEEHDNILDKIGKYIYYQNFTLGGIDIDGLKQRITTAKNNTYIIKFIYELYDNINQKF
jgi:hypothetical protein